MFDFFICFSSGQFFKTYKPARTKNTHRIKMTCSLMSNRLTPILKSKNLSILTYIYIFRNMRNLNRRLFYVSNIKIDRRVEPMIFWNIFVFVFDSVATKPTSTWTKQREKRNYGLICTLIFMLNIFIFYRKKILLKVEKV